MSNFCIFLYQEIKIKSNFSPLFEKGIDIFILIGSKICIDSLSEDNKKIFHKIIILKKFDYDVIDDEIKDYIKYKPVILTNEESCAIICSKIREKYKLNGSYFQDISPFVDKIIMKKKLESYEIRIPLYEKFNYHLYDKEPEEYIKYIENKISYPMIVKPVSGFGSINTLNIYSRENLDKYIFKNLKSRVEFEIDEHIEGDLYHCDGLVQNGEIVFSLFCRYNTPCINFSHGKSLGSLILEYNHDVKKSLFEFSNIVVKATSVPDGAFHLEVFLNRKQELVFLEIAARTPGALVIPVYEKMFGFNFEEQHYRIQLGKPNISSINNHKKYAAWMIFPMCDGIVKSFNQPHLKSKYQIEYFVKIGQKTESSKDLSSVAASIIIEDESYNKILSDFKELNSFSPVSYEN